MGIILLSHFTLGYVSHVPGVVRGVSLLHDGLTELPFGLLFKLSKLSYSGNSERREGKRG